MIRSLKCNGAEFPINVDRRAVITWIPGGVQEEFCLTLSLDGEVVFDSGRIRSALPIYSLRQRLLPLKEYVYTVKIICADGSGEAEGKFRTAYTEGFCKEAEWIGYEQRPVCSHPVNGNPATVLQREFEVEQLKPTYLHFAGLGLSEAYVNGNRVGDGVLDCAFTSYDKSVLYSTHRIDGLLRLGRNVITVVLGDGWYNQTPPDEWNFYKAEWRDNCKAVISVEGGAELVSDRNWMAWESDVIVSSALRLGEVHDYSSGKNLLKMPDNARKAALMAPPSGKLKSQDCFEIKEVERIEFVSAVAYEGGYILDFGREIAGYAHCRLAFDGGEIKLRYGDRLEGGRIDNTSNGQYVFAGEYQTDKIIASRGEVDFKPRFVYHCFRYIEVEGLSAPPRAGEITAVMIRSGFEKTGDFKCSDEGINGLYKSAITSFECNYTGFPTDCPHREKNGWTGDMQLSAEAYLTSFDISPNLYKWLEDIAEVQLEDGMLPCIVPTSGWGYNWGNGPAWDYALFALPDAMLAVNGDGFAGEEFLPVMQRYFEFLSSRAVDNLVDWGLGDWNYPKKIDIDLAPVRLTSSCYMYAMANKIASIMREKGDLSSFNGYCHRAEEIKKAILREYGEERDCITSVAALIYFGLVEGDVKEQLLDRLSELLREVNYTCRTGILGAKFVNNVLCESGRVDEFIKILRCREYPSFGYWMDNGATALWEDFEGTNSRCHHMFGDFAKLLQRYVAGIRADLHKDGIKLVIQPFMCDLGHIYGKMTIPGGEVLVECIKQNGKLEAEITVPGGAQATFAFEGKEYKLTKGKNVLAIEYTK